METRDIYSEFDIKLDLLLKNRQTDKVLAKKIAVELWSDHSDIIVNYFIDCQDLLDWIGDYDLSDSLNELCL